MKERKKILIIDDEIEIRNDLQDALSINNYDVISASNGFEGFEQILKYNPDLIICDVMMPVMSGYELLSLIRKNESISNIPFLFLTGKSDYEAQREGMNLGADDYLIKPYNYNDLIKSIQTRLEKSNIEKSIYENKLGAIKSSIYRSIPHEIRTPLNGILNNSEWILKNSNEISIAKLRDKISDIHKDAYRLNRLFENYIFIIKLKLLTHDILELEKIRNSYTLNPNQVVTDISNIFFLKNSSIKCVLNVRNNVDKINISDLHFHKIIFELMENASKFSYQNSVVKVNCICDDNNYLFSIQNQGTKFPKNKVNEINDFIQFDRSFYEQSGVGIGLSVVKQILDIYGSDLTIETNDEITNVSFKLSI